MAFERDYFKTDAFMAIKLLGRVMCRGFNSAGWVVKEIHRRFPGFIRAWEAWYNRPWKGDDWFESRIDHGSINAGNKVSQLRIIELVTRVANDRSVYQWHEWEELVATSIQEVKAVWYLYLLPWRDSYNGPYNVQKPGITTAVYNRYNEYKDGRHTVGKNLWIAPGFVLTCEIGQMHKYEAESIEKQCGVLLGKGNPTRFGCEWFNLSTLEAINIMVEFTKARGWKPKIIPEIMEVTVDHSTPRHVRIG